MEYNKVIYGKIADIIKDIGPIAKTKKNTSQGFMYRGVDDVINALSSAFEKNRVMMIPTVLDMKREEKTTKSGGALVHTILTVKYTVYAEDGSNVESIVVGEAMDSGDKSCNKAMSAALKYACFQIFCIPTEEMKDADQESHEIIHTDAALNMQIEKLIKMISESVEDGKISKEKVQEIRVKNGVMKAGDFKTRKQFDDIYSDYLKALKVGD
jgi:hypothetical protein